MTTPANILKADHFASKWLAAANKAEEQGNKAKAEKCFTKCQYWLDRFNRLSGNA
jgi:hypothetical protein